MTVFRRVERWSSNAKAAATEASVANGEGSHTRPGSRPLKPSGTRNAVVAAIGGDNAREGVWISPSWDESVHESSPEGTWPQGRREGSCPSQRRSPTPRSKVVRCRGAFVRTAIGWTVAAAVSMCANRRWGAAPES
jgi:hypothetical protein